MIRWLRSGLRPLLLPPAVPGQEHHLPVNRVWLAIERITFLLGAFAAATTIFGIVSWYRETDARKIERANKTYEATAGALSTIKDSRGHAAQIGQSEALKLLLFLGRSTNTVDLNDIYISGLKLPTSLFQPHGAMVALDQVSLTSHYEHPAGQSDPGASLLHDDDRCRSSKVIGVDWVVASNLTLDGQSWCVLGSFAGRYISSPGAATPLRKFYQSPLHIGYAQVRSDLVKGLFSAEDQVNAGGEAQSPSNEGLPTFFIAARSALEWTDLEINSDFADIEYSSLYRSKVTMTGVYAKFAGVSLRGAQVLAPKLQDLAQTEQEEAACRRLVAKQPAPAARGSQPLFNHRDVVYASCQVQLAMEAIGDRVHRYVPADQTLYIMKADIRGADLSALPASHVVFDGVCAGPSTKLPPGIKLKACAGPALAYWNAVDQCRLHAQGNSAALTECWRRLDDNLWKAHDPREISDGSQTTVRINIIDDTGHDLDQLERLIRRIFTNDDTERRSSNPSVSYSETTDELGLFPAGAMSFVGDKVVGRMAK